MQNPTKFITPEQVPTELRELRQWVGFRLFPKDNEPGEFKKPPYSPVNGKSIGANSLTDEEKKTAIFEWPTEEQKKAGIKTDWSPHWLTLAEAIAGAKKFGLDGVGFVFTPEDPYCGADWDDVRNKDTGVIDPIVASWLKNHFGWSYSEASISGTGAHSIFKATLKKAVDKPVPQADGCRVELYSTDRFFTWSGDLLEGHPLEVKDCSITRLLIDLGVSEDASAPGDSDHPMFRSTALRIHNENLVAFRAKTAPEDDQNATLNASAFWAARCFISGVFDKGVTEAKLRAELIEIAESSGHCAPSITGTCDSGWKSGVARGPLKIKEGGDTPELMALMKEFNAKFFVCEDYGKKVPICWLEKEDTHEELLGRETLKFQTWAEWQKRLVNTKVIVGYDKQGSPIFENKAVAWWFHEDRRQHSRVVFLPGKKVNGNKFNLWTGFAFEPKKGNCELYLEHINQVICNGDKVGYDYTIGWLANAVQRPWERGHVALAWRGEKGKGKNVAADEFGRMWGAHYFTVSNAEHFVGRFNSHLRGVSVLTVNEAFHVRNKQHEATLKTLVTDATLPIEQKFVDAETDVNLLHIIMLSNSEWVVPATLDERRFCMMDVCAKKQGEDYFTKLIYQMRHGGSEALLWFLQNYDLSGFDIRKPPHTDAERSQISYSLTGFPQVYYENLVSGRIVGIRQKDGSVQVLAHKLLNWAAKKRPKDWGAISEQAVGFLLGDNERGGKQKGFGYRTTRPRLDGKPGPRYYTIPNLSERIEDDRNVNTSQLDSDPSMKKTLKLSGDSPPVWTCLENMLNTLRA